MKAKKVAIAGFGFMGRTHYGNWKKIRGAKVVAICDSNLAQLTNKVKGNVGCADGSTDFSGIDVYSDFDEMLAKCPCDIVDVTLPTPLHPRMVESALAAGKDVISEKPMAIDSRTCDAMLAASRKAKGRFMVAQCLRFQAEHVYVKKLIDGGRYGKVVSADFARVSMTPGWGAGGGKSWFLDEAKSGGVALDLHIHDTDLVNWWFGKPESVTSRERRRADGVGVHIATSYAYPDKVVNAVGSWVDAPSFVFEASFRVVFERAVVVCDTRRTPSFVVYPGKDKPFTPKFKNADGYLNELKAFLDWTRRPYAESPFEARAARDSVAIVDAERKSAKTGRAVRILSALALCAGVALGNPVYTNSFPDPTAWRAPDGTWRAASTSMKILKSGDFLHWTDTGKRIFPFKEARRIRGKWKHVWAPDVFRIGDKYLMYVALVNSATNSAIAVYSSKGPDGPFTGGRIITRSGDTGIQDTIDPEVVRDDRDGTLWLFFGSTGKMHRVRLSPDGRSIAPGAKYEHVAGLAGNVKDDPMRQKVFEGAYLHRRGGWWYLFASRGCYWNHTYAIVVGRARTLDGPFLDRKGRKMTDGFATTVLSSKEDDIHFGPGHNGEIVTIGGRDYIPYHCHVAGDNPVARPLFISEVVWDSAGWPKVVAGL